MKSGASFFGIDVKYLSVVFLIIYYEKPGVKTTLTTMGPFLLKEVKSLSFRHNL